MILVKLQRQKRIFFTLGCSFMLGILVINLFLDPLQQSQVGVLNDIERDPQNFENDRIFGFNFGRVQRKPKATYDRHLNENENSNQVVGDFFQHKSNTDNGKENPLHKKHKENKNTTKSKEEDDEEYVYEEDIYKVVIEGDQDGSSDEIENKEENNIADNSYTGNKILIPGTSNIIHKRKNVGNILRFQQKTKIHSSNNRVSKLSEKQNHSHDAWKITSIVQPEKIYWSESVESLIPHGESWSDVNNYVTKIRDEPVQYLEPPAWDKCGRPKNGYVTMQNGLHVCARYREPHNKMVLGEVLSFYLSRFLGMDSVPAVVLSQTNHSSSQWAGIPFQELDWKEGTFVALIQWIPHIASFGSLVKMPQVLLDAYWNKTIINADFLSKTDGVTSPASLSQLRQWGEMILFDYITGNYDRIASMQDAVMKENKPSILSEHIRNLHKSTTTDKLWLIDNESGLFDAYELMYHAYRGEKFIKFHADMLQTFCIFPKSVIESLRRLSKERQPHTFLEAYARQYEPLIDAVPKDITYKYFQQHFHSRIQDILHWVDSCVFSASQ